MSTLIKIFLPKTHLSGSYAFKTADCMLRTRSSSVEDPYVSKLLFIGRIGSYYSHYLSGISSVCRI